MNAACSISAPREIAWGNHCPTLMWQFNYMTKTSGVPFLFHYVNPWVHLRGVIPNQLITNKVAFSMAIPYSISIIYKSAL